MELHHDQTIAKQRRCFWEIRSLSVSLFPSRLIFPPSTSRRSPFLLFFLSLSFFFSSLCNLQIAPGRAFCSSFFFSNHWRKTIDHEMGGHASENCSQLTARATTSGRTFFFLGQLETRVPRKLVPNEQSTKSLGFFQDQGEEDFFDGC